MDTQHNYMHTAEHGPNRIAMGRRTMLNDDNKMLV